jgi:hypothetical protein
MRQQIFWLIMPCQLTNECWRIVEMMETRPRRRRCRTYDPCFQIRERDLWWWDSLRISFHLHVGCPMIKESIGISLLRPRVKELQTAAKSLMIQDITLGDLCVDQQANLRKMKNESWSTIRSPIRRIAWFSCSIFFKAFLDFLNFLNLLLFVYCLGNAFIKLENAIRKPMHGNLLSTSRDFSWETCLLEFYSSGSCIRFILFSY